MATIDRQKMMTKIRALLSKTTENGCTEAEAMAALDMAQRFMASYEVTPDDLQLKGETAEVRRAAARDPHKARYYMAAAVAGFAGCKVWRGSEGLNFCGLQSDAELAAWLLETLGGFVEREFARHLAERRGVGPRERRLAVAGFVIGATGRIAARLNELTTRTEQAANSNGRALVVVKGRAVAEKMASMGINLRKGRTSGRSINGDSYRAGQASGDRASFGRPVGGNGGQARLR